MNNPEQTEQHVHDVSSGNGPRKEKTPRERIRKHGLLTLRRHLTDLGSRAIDGRSTVAVNLRKWRQELIRDLGGHDSLSTQQLSLVELAPRSKIMLDSIHARI